MVNPVRCAVDSSGNLYIVDQGASVIREVTIATGVITTFAGVNNTPGFAGDNGPATAAQMNSPAAAIFDASGNLYVTDQANQRIRKIDTNGIITTVAGNGVAAFAGDQGDAKSASLNFPGEIAIDPAEQPVYCGYFEPGDPRSDGGGNYIDGGGNSRAQWHRRRLRPSHGGAIQQSAWG